MSVCRAVEPVARWRLSSAEVPLGSSPTASAGLGDWKTSVTPMRPLVVRTDFLFRLNFHFHVLLLTAFSVRCKMFILSLDLFSGSQAPAEEIRRTTRKGSGLTPRRRAIPWADNYVRVCVCVCGMRMKLCFSLGGNTACETFDTSGDHPMAFSVCLRKIRRR